MIFPAIANGPAGEIAPMILLNTPDALAKALERAVAARAPQVPLVAAAASGRFVYAAITDPESRWARCLDRDTRPTVVVVHADAGEDTDPLPAEWACLGRLRRWVGFTIIHAAGGEPHHYRLAVAMAEQYGRVALVECTPRTADAWADAIRFPPERSLLIWPDGGVHPIAPKARH